MLRCNKEPLWINRNLLIYSSTPYYAVVNWHSM